jgi:large subunit ribosomal protein L20
MTRIKRGVAAHKRRKNVIKRAKGYQNRRRTNFPAAREALLHADSYAYAHRRLKKRDFRSLWTVRINAATRENGLSFSKFMEKLHKNKVIINKKMLAEIANRYPEVFDEMVKKLS